MIPTLMKDDKDVEGSEVVEQVLKTEIIIVISVAALVVAIGVVVVILLCFRRRKISEKKDQNTIVVDRHGKDNLAMEVMEVSIKN